MTLWQISLLDLMGMWSPINVFNYKKKAKNKKKKKIKKNLLVYLESTESAESLTKLLQSPNPDCNFFGYSKIH
ncbi:hypothetical protein QG37_08009 [Candidozyma auris]|nr:hypothetical protein QG37_08009 [[Candida] auris]